MNSLDFKQAVDDQPVPVQRAPMRAQEPLDLNERLATHAHRIRQQAEHLVSVNLRSSMHDTRFARRCQHHQLGMRHSSIAGG